MRMNLLKSQLLHPLCRSASQLELSQRDSCCFRQSGGQSGLRGMGQHPLSVPSGRFGLWRVSLLAVAALGLAISGCSSIGPSRDAPNPAEQSDPAQTKGEAGKSGAQLWAARCGQCHFARDAGYFSDTQWEVIMLHMRVRANLTAAEHQTILEFLKSSN